MTIFSKQYIGRACYVYTLQPVYNQGEKRTLGVHCLHSVQGLFWKLDFNFQNGANGKLGNLQGFFFSA